MNEMIKVSIITPSFNQGQFIEETIQSVLNQTYKNIQYIIVDGGSTDNTMDVVGKYRDKIDIIIHEKDNGQTDAINKGFKMAAGELVGWINSDDILYTDCVEKIVNIFIAKSNASILYSSFLNRIDSNGKIIGRTQRGIINRNYLLNYDFNVIQPGSFYSSRSVNEVGFLNEKINYCMDLDLWLKLLSKGEIYSFDEHPLAAYRKWEATKTANGGLKFLREIEKTLNYHGMKILCRNNRIILWNKIKLKIKSILKS